MKIRTDFVTNSSSSSFIFKEYSEHEVEKAIERRLSIPPRDEWEARAYEWVKDVGKWIEGERFQAHSLYDLYEVLGWYENDVLSNIFAMEPCKDFSEYKNWEERFKQLINNKTLSQEEERRLTAKFVLDVYLDNFDRNYTWNSKDEGIKIVSMDFLNNEIWEYMGAWEREGDLLADYYVEHIEAFLKSAEQFEGKSIAEVMEIFFDAQYLYFDEMETHYLICEAIKEAGICLYSCGHMG